MSEPPRERGRPARKWAAGPQVFQALGSPAFPLAPLAPPS